MERDQARWLERSLGRRLFGDSLMRASAALLVAEHSRGAIGGATQAVRGTPKVRLKDLDLGEGRLIMAACADDEVARQDAEIGHGVFTYYLIDALKHSRSVPHYQRCQAL